MARQSKLKVFRTPIGFHDAYVAAPSQKAALEAWGSENNLFASGAAERVDDPEQMIEPLAHPGQVIRRVRGTVAEHLAALPKDEPRRAARAKSAARLPKEESSPPRTNTAMPKRKPKPRPSRVSLDCAEAELGEVDTRQRAQRDALARRQADLDRERQKVESSQARERQKIERRLEAQQDKYERAMRAWRES